MHIYYFMNMRLFIFINNYCNLKINELLWPYSSLILILIVFVKCRIM